MSSVGAAVVAGLLTAGCNVFEKQPERYNNVSGAKRPPILNPGGSNYQPPEVLQKKQNPDYPYAGQTGQATPQASMQSGQPAQYPPDYLAQQQAYLQSKQTAQPEEQKEPAGIFNNFGMAGMGPPPGMAQSPDAPQSDPQQALDNSLAAQPEQRRVPLGNQQVLGGQPFPQSSYAAAAPVDQVVPSPVAAPVPQTEMMDDQTEPTDEQNKAENAMMKEGKPLESSADDQTEPTDEQDIAENTMMKGAKSYPDYPDLANVPAKDRELEARAERVRQEATAFSGEEPMTQEETAKIDNDFSMKVDEKYQANEQEELPWEPVETEYAEPVDTYEPTAEMMQDNSENVVYEPDSQQALPWEEEQTASLPVEQAEPVTYQEFDADAVAAGEPVAAEPPMSEPAGEPVGAPQYVMPDPAYAPEESNELVSEDGSIQTETYTAYEQDSFEGLDNEPLYVGEPVDVEEYPADEYAGYNDAPVYSENPAEPEVYEPYNSYEAPAYYNADGTEYSPETAEQQGAEGMKPIRLKRPQGRSGTEFLPESRYKTMRSTSRQRMYRHIR
jgi:hypothetical protein